MLSICLLVVSLFLEAPSEWEELPCLKQTEGYAGAFAGESNGCILLAGGANFPDRKPWDGGTKSWYKEVYALDQNRQAWKSVGKLPNALGYGISASYHGKLLCVGGSDAHRHYADVFQLEYKHEQLQVSQLPALPVALANGSGVLVGSRLFVIGGQADPTSTPALSRVWSMDLSVSTKRWREEASIPGPGRILSTAATHDGAVYVFGGAELFTQDGVIQRKYLKDAYVLRPGGKWKKLPDIPNPLAASATPAPVWGNKIYLVSGDDGSQVGRFQAEHRGFPATIWSLDLDRMEWSQAGTTPAPRVTLPCVQVDREAYFLSGEKSPGVRSPEIWRWNLTHLSR